MGRLFIAILAILSFTSLYGEGFCQSITFSYSSLIGIQSPLWIARDAGFFKKHRIDANVVYTPGGYSVIQEMLSGRLQMAIGTAGASADYRGRVVFEKLGLRVGTDVVFVQTVGGQPTRLAMLQSGN